MTLELEERIYTIYKHTSPSGKGYIGQSKDIIKREKQHQKSYKCPAFRNAINKYGWDNFIHEILEENLTQDEANIFEELYIEEHNTLSPNGYNLRGGGNTANFSEETCEKIRQVRLGTKSSKETCAKISINNTGEGNPFFGKHHTKEICDKLSEMNTGKNHPQYGKTGELSPNWGKKISKETIQKRTESIYKIYIITFPDGYWELIKGLKPFCDKYNLRHSSMSGVAKGRCTHHKGFKCRYATAEEKALYETTINI